jgi:protein phosphatase
VAGNHDIKLMRKLKGRDVKMTHGLKESMEQLEAEPDIFKKEIVRFFDSLISHYQFDGGKLLVAHAGLKQDFHGRTSNAVRDFALYGDTTGETDEYGFPVRYPWAQDYRGDAIVVYGHTTVREPEWINRTICIDTGCVFGGKLTALRYPELKLESVEAARTYYEPSRPFAADALESTGVNGGESGRGDLLDITDVLGKRIISTRLRPNINIREENAIAALEVMSRFAIDPRWLVYLPPTMSPCETSHLPGFLEHPSEAFDYYRKQNVQRVMCQQKHMGSRAVVIVCRTPEAAVKRFGATTPGAGVCYTRTGRPFFHDDQLEIGLIEQVRKAAERSGLWQELNTDWLMLDCELMPWSAKAQELLRQQYAAVGVAAATSLTMAQQHLSLAAQRLPDAVALRDKIEQRLRSATKYRDAYRRYCWTVNDLADLKLAPFHLLASEGAVHMDKDHRWHMRMAARLADADENKLLMATAHREIDLADEASVQSGIDWWCELTSKGGEGMVVKPIDFIITGERGLVQPAVKCRGQEYLRIIYGPEYDIPEHLNRLRSRGLGAKRSMAVREFALGAEALERFVARDPLYKVHECVFGVLALESEPVDPRL